MIYKFLCCVSLFFLFSCTSRTNTALPPAQLKDLLKQNLVLLPDNNFEYLPPFLKEKEVIFVGEFEHHNKFLSLAAGRFAVYIASHKPVVYALETSYSSHLLFETVSMNCKRKIGATLYTEDMRKFNFNQTENKKILLTAIDIEHSLYNNKKETQHFLHGLASRSTSETARRAINEQVARLTDQDTFEKMNRYLRKLKKAFLQHSDTFSPEDQDEILFSMELLTASNRFYQYIAAGGLKEAIMRPWNIRTKYFIKTIERAYQKAQKRNSTLICRVGAPHASLTNKYFEARYFAKKYSLTKGRVSSIGLVPLYYDTHKTNDTVTEEHNDIDSIVKIIMKDNEYSYLSLSELQKNTGNSFKWSKYYSDNGPQYDGLLFVKIEKNSN